MTLLVELARPRPPFKLLYHIRLLDGFVPQALQPASHAYALIILCAPLTHDANRKRPLRSPDDMGAHRRTTWTRSSASRAARPSYSAA